MASLTFLAKLIAYKVARFGVASTLALVNREGICRDGGHLLRPFKVAGAWWPSRQHRARWRRMGAATLVADGTNTPRRFRRMEGGVWVPILDQHGRRRASVTIWYDGFSTGIPSPGGGPSMA